MDHEPSLGHRPLGGVDQQQHAVEHVYDRPGHGLVVAEDPGQFEHPVDQGGLAAVHVGDDQCSSVRSVSMSKHQHGPAGGRGLEVEQCRMGGRVGTRFVARSDSWMSWFAHTAPSSFIHNLAEMLAGLIHGDLVERPFRPHSSK